MREDIVETQIKKAIEAVKVMASNKQEEIGERDLRKIINQTMPGVSLFHKNCFIESLRTFKPADDLNMFRRFLVKEVEEALEQVMHFPLELGQSQSFHFSAKTNTLAPAQTTANPSFGT